MKLETLMSRPAPDGENHASPRGADPRSGPRDRLGVWCGWVMVGAAVLAVLIGWLAPLGFAPLLAVTGLLCLPAMRIEDADRPVLIVLFAALVWAAITMMWTPFHPKSWSNETTIQLALALPLAWSAICGARRADPALARRALAVLTWGVGVMGVLLISESFTDAAIYKWLHVAFYEPIRGDLAERNVGDATFVFAVLWPICMGAAPRLRDAWPLAPGVAGTLMAAHVFGADAPVIAAPLALAAALLVWRQPRLGPGVIAAGAIALFELMPMMVWGVRASGLYGRIEHLVPLSWEYRMGYWSRTIDWIGQRPFRGWGLDSSRMMGGGMALHPHNDALQIWLELGLPGALLASAFWGLVFLRMRRSSPSWAAGCAAGAVCVYLLYASVSFGVWQGWFVGLGGFIAVLATLLPRARQAAA